MNIYKIGRGIVYLRAIILYLGTLTPNPNTMNSRLYLVAVLVIFSNLSSFAQFEWVKFNGEMPGNVVIGGQENGGDLAVCRALYDDVFHAGKVVAGNCNFGWGGNEILAPDFEVLVDKGSVRFSWETFNGEIPANAVEAGDDGSKKNFVCQAEREDGSVHPGKAFGVDGDYICNYGYGGNEIVVKSGYKILTASPIGLVWLPYSGSIPSNAVSGGNERGRDLPVCRANYKGALHPGKVVGKNCNIGWGGKEVVIPSFEVLTNEGMTLSWQTLNGTIPESAVAAGQEGSKILYVGQVTRPDGSVHSGKIFGAPGNYIFNYGYGGAEITVKTKFRILVQYNGSK